MSSGCTGKRARAGLAMDRPHATLLASDLHQAGAPALAGDDCSPHRRRVALHLAQQVAAFEGVGQRGAVACGEVFIGQ